MVTGASSRCLTGLAVGPKNPIHMFAERQQERRHRRAFQSMDNFAAMERLWACPLMVFGPAELTCKYCLRSQDEIALSLGNPVVPLLHRCWAGSSRSKCPNFRYSPEIRGPCLYLDCWPLPKGNGLHCARCDGPSQLCEGHRWACPDKLLCKDCIHEERPTRVMQILGHLDATSYGIVLELKAINPVSGEVARTARECVPPYHDEIEAACLSWLLELIASVYEQDDVNELRYNQDGYRWSRARFAEGASDAASAQEWAIAGRRSIAVAILIPTSGLPVTFAEHQATAAARGLVQYLTDHGMVTQHKKPFP